MSDEHWLRFGAWLKEQRVASRWSRRKLAQIAGISDSSWANYERGGRWQDGKWWIQRPSAETLQGIAKALGLTEEEVFSRAGAGGAPVGEQSDNPVSSPDADDDDDKWIRDRLEEAGVPVPPASVRLTERRHPTRQVPASEDKFLELQSELREQREMIQDLKRMLALAIKNGLFGE